MRHVLGVSVAPVFAGVFVPASAVLAAGALAAGFVFEIAIGVALEIGIGVELEIVVVVVNVIVLAAVLHEVVHVVEIVGALVLAFAHVSAFAGWNEAVRNVGLHEQAWSVLAE